MSSTTNPPEAPRVLVVDDEQMIHRVFERFLTRHGMGVTSCTSASQALVALEAGRFDLVITDFQMPEMDGLELIAHVREHHPRLPVIMITGHASVQHAVRAMAKGAVDYLPKPFTADVLLERVQHALANGATSAPPARPQPAARPASPASASTTTEFVGRHPSVLQLKELLPRFAKSKASVFVHGESGTGKEVLARLIHEHSDRAGGPFVALNCANLPSELVESHLFGHKKGAFTGAVEDMTGAFGRADGGTILLDEVTEVDPVVQAKLLRVLQEEEIQRVGSEAVTKVDVRVIATSNRDLHDAIDRGDFREDLFHRLAVFPLYVPPLRERRSDIPLLAEHFVRKYCALYGYAPKIITPDLRAYLEARPWPGNVRELGNLVHRGVVLAADRELIRMDDVVNAFFSGTGPSNDTSFLHTEHAPSTLDDMERLMIIKALQDHGYNRERAAEQLGVSARTIRNKLKRYREEGLIEEDAFRRTG